VPIVSLICFLMGMILGFQGITQMKRFGIDIYVADLVGLGIVRELGPLMVA
jgi:phospholipid/cholesterol/gamma-HCH transport system permease protein